LKELEDIALEKIRDAAKKNTLLQTPKLAAALYSWRDWSNEEEVKQWARGLSKDTELATLLESLLQKSSSISLSDVAPRTNYHLDMQWFEHHLEPSEIIDRVRSLLTNSELTEMQKLAANQFVQAYEARQQVRRGVKGINSELHKQEVQ
jgi:predicted KAP-like P-loop ATPase